MGIKTRRILIMVPRKTIFIVITIYKHLTRLHASYFYLHHVSALEVSDWLPLCIERL